MKYTFETALVFLKQGKKVRRAAWLDQEEYKYLYLFLDETRFAYGEIDRSTIWYTLTLEGVDILADDWMVMDE